MSALETSVVMASFRRLPPLPPGRELAKCCNIKTGKCPFCHYKSKRQDGLALLPTVLSLKCPGCLRMNNTENSISFHGCLKFVA